MGKERNIRGKLPDYLTHPLSLAAAAILGITLIAAPVIHISTTKAADKPLATVSEAGAPAPEVQTSRTPAPAVAKMTAAPKTTAAAPEETASAESPAAPKTRLIAFYGNFDEEGYKSLEKNAADIDVLMPMWYHLGSNGKLTFDASHASQVNQIIKAKNPGMKVMPIVNNYDKASESWNAPQVGKLIADPTKRKQIARHIVSTLDKAGYDGVNVDFESFTEKDRGNLVKFMAELYPLARKAGLEVSMDVIVLSKTYDHPNLAKHVDYLIPMMYDEHWKTSAAGPISSAPWFEKTLKRFLAQVPAEKVVVGMGTYSYDWGKAGSRAKSLTYRKAAALAKQSKKPIKLAEPAMNSSFKYKSSDGWRSVWMLDSMSAFNQVSIASKHKVRGYAIWRVGAEDPNLWKVLPNRDKLDRSVAESLGGTGRSIAYDDASKLIVRGRVNP